MPVASIHGNVPDSFQSGKVKYHLFEVDANILTPNVRGSMIGHAYGMVELRARLIDPAKADTIFDKTYAEAAKDGDPDIPLPWSAAVTIEQAGKLVTSTSIKRIADRMIKDIHAALAK